MRNARTYIAETDAREWPLADGSCVSVVTHGLNFELDAGLIRTARV
jgi:hypothetical protein